MNKEFPLEFVKRKAIVFNVKQEGSANEYISIDAELEKGFAELPKIPGIQE